MADVVCVDKRRTDLRKNTRYNPYWISSALCDVVALSAEDLAIILFSFPVASRVTVVHDVMFQVVDIFTVSAGAALCTVGLGTIATDAVTTGGNVTTVDVDSYILSASITFGTAGYYHPLSASTSTWLTSQMGGTVTQLASQYIVGAAATVPVVAAYPSNAGGAITAGSFRVHMLVSELPGY